MRRWIWLACALLVATACGEAAQELPTTTSQPAEVTTTSAATSTASTGQPSTTTTGTPTPPGQWTVAALGRNPEDSFVGGALGSGCSPGTESLPDGVWFGWIEEAKPSSVEFDLACLWAGRLDPAARNDASRIRVVGVADEGIVYLDENPTSYADWSKSTAPADNAPGLPDGLPYWLFVNNGLVTELAQYPETTNWALSATAWPEYLAPGCCDQPDVAPPSPLDPYPEQGWPPDGFYKAWPDGSPESWIDTETGESYQLSLFRWLSCDANPDLCPEWWAGGVIEDPSSLLERDLPLDDDLTVVIMPVLSDIPLVGDGTALRDLLDDMNGSLAEHWPIPEMEELLLLAEDPHYPFGVPRSDVGEEGWPVSYRGPGGTYLTWFGGWMALEMRNGLPILYIHAGLVAG